MFCYKNKPHCSLCGLCIFLLTILLHMMQVLCQKVEVICVSQRFLTMSIVFEQEASFYIIYKLYEFFWTLFYFQQASHFTLAHSFPGMLQQFSGSYQLLPNSSATCSCDTRRSIFVNNETKEDFGGQHCLADKSEI